MFRFFICILIFVLMGFAGDDVVAQAGAVDSVDEGAKAVYFSDRRLKSLIEEVLKVTDPNILDMEKLTELEIPHEPVASLSGLQYACNLEGLDISYTKIKSLRNLNRLKNLKWLGVSGCDISSWSRLRQIKALESLTADRCGLTDISFVTDLEGLTFLSMNDNLISDLTPLQSMFKLKQIVMYGNRISDISPLVGLSDLEELSLGRNRIEEISVLSSLTKLTYVSLFENRIKDISSLINLKNLCSVCIQNNPLHIDSLKLIPTIYQNLNQDFWVRSIIYGNCKVLNPGIATGNTANDYVINYSWNALSHDEKYLAITAGKRSTRKFGEVKPWNENFIFGQAYLLELAESGTTVCSVPKSHGTRSMAWRPDSSELLVLKLGLFYGEPDSLKTFRVQDGEQPKMNYSFSFPIGHFFYTNFKPAWTLDGKYLLVRAGSYSKKNAAMMNYETRKISFHDMPRIRQHCLLDSGRICASTGEQLFYITVSDRGKTSYELSLKKEDSYAMRHKDLLLSGPVDGKPVYSLDLKKIFLGEKQIYDAIAEIFNLYADDGYIAFQNDFEIRVIDHEGNTVYFMATDKRYRILALAGKRKVLYLLNKQQTIEAVDLNGTGQVTEIFNVSQIVSE